jgi:hypothetical protein
LRQPKEGKDMRWSTVRFGKYKGKTLPEIIVRDLDWFLWILPKLYGKLAKEGRNLARKARAIKIPKRYGRNLEVEYRFGIEHRFCGFGFVKAEAQRSQWTTRLPYLDFKWSLRGKNYNKRAGRIMIRDFRTHYFGARKRLTKGRCEEFFSNDANFIDV